MGYESFVSGQLLVRPAIDPTGTTFEGEDAELIVSGQGGTEDTVDLVDGEIKVIPGDSWSVVECAYQEPYPADDLTGQVKALVKLARDRGSVVNGTLRVSGENNDDIWRIRVEDNAVHVENPRLLWPNGEEEAL